LFQIEGVSRQGSAPEKIDDPEKTVEPEIEKETPRCKVCPNGEAFADWEEAEKHLK
jgi:hypothetical protein